MEEEGKGLGSLPTGPQKTRPTGDEAIRVDKDGGKGQRKQESLLLLSLEKFLGCLGGSRQPQRGAKIPKEGGR